MKTADLLAEVISVYGDPRRLNKAKAARNSVLAFLASPLPSALEDCEIAPLRPELSAAGLRYCLRHHDYIQPDEPLCGKASR